MAKKKTTFADEANRIRNKYYKNREPGDDTMSDEAFNMEMKQLQVKQEAVKSKEEPQQQQQMSQEGGQGQQMQIQQQGMQSNQPMANRANGGGLPKYDGLQGYSNLLNSDYNSGFGNNLNNAGGFGLGYQFGENQGALSLNQQSPSPYGYSNVLSGNTNTGISVNSNPNLTTANQSVESGNSYSPTANPLMPLATIGTNLVANQILKNNAEKRKTSLLKNVGVDLGRVNAQQIDLGRDRANIKANQALTEASGRYAARGARSASEAARISNAARLGGQRISGNLLSKSMSQQEQTNAKLRADASNKNLELSNQEKLMKAQQIRDIDQRYGDIPAQLNADFARSTGQTAMNYFGENAKMQRDYNFLQMSQPNLSLDYQEQFNKLTPFQQKLRQMGIGEVNTTITAR